MKQTSGTFECVRVYDPAIEWPDDDPKAAREYQATRDMSKLRFVDPAIGRPMVFVCRRLSQSQRKAVTSAADNAEAFRKAFQYGVLSVRNYDRDGQLVTWEPKRRADDAMMNDACLDDFGEDDVQEIGHVIRGQSFLGRGVPLRLPPLASSVDAFQAVSFLFAERKKASETQTETKSG
jgi:hypothetical protein